MENQAQRIKALRKEKGLTQQQLADLCGVKRPAVSQWEADPRVKITGHNLSKLCRALDVSAAFVLEGKEQPTRPSTTGIGMAYKAGAITGATSNLSRFARNVSEAPPLAGMCPEISWVQAGAWAEVCDINTDPETTNWYPRPPGASEQTFVLRVVGESMVPDYPPGRLIFVDPEQAPLPNDDVVAVMTESNEATFKRLIEEPGSPRMLKALNPAWNNPYLEINGNCQIIGVVIADMRMRQR
jgi:SOS-response transcriptional repressor LexA